MDHQSAKRATIILGIVMIVAIASSAILPLFTQDVTDATPVPTTIPVPTFGPSITDFSGIRFDNDYLHASGLFSVANPTGWTPGTETSNTTGAEITMNNTDILSVIQISLQVSAAPIQSMDELDAIYTSSALNQSWSNYRRDAQTGLNYRETARTRDGNNLTMDFELKNQREQIFVARQIAWYDTDWVYSVRVVTPENQIELLKYLVDNLKASYHANRIFAGTPIDWQAYFDQTNNFIIRYPTSWIVTDSAPGRPASIDGNTGSLRVEAQPGVVIGDEAAARAWVEATRTGVTILSVQPATRGTLNGFSVAYTYNDVDGNPNSGLALLLNGTDNAVHVANLRLFKANVDLNVDTAQVENFEAYQILQTFNQLEGVTVPLPTPTPTPTLPPTLAPTATPEATVEVTSEATVEATPEATTEATPEASVETTAEATAEATPGS
ncbi:MAG: hypothetical protein K8L97_01230 [Anaerolineae bacterium]|nr:hypothetical protein [Anaerolineae bacterium]